MYIYYVYSDNKMSERTYDKKLCLLIEKSGNFFLRHEESPEKPQYNTTTPQFLDKRFPFCTFLAKTFRPLYFHQF